MAAATMALQQQVHMARLVSVDDELEKWPSLRRHHLTQLRDWVSHQPHLPSSVPDQQLILFLTSNDLSLERAKDTLDRHYTIKTHAPEFFGQRDPFDTDIQDIFNTVQMCVMSDRDKYGNRVFVGRLGDTNPERFYFVSAVKAMQLVMETSLREEGAAPGYVFVYDMKGVQVGHIARMSLQAVRKYLAYVQTGLPIKMKAVHILNITPVVHNFLNLIKPLMKRDLFNMFHFYSGGYDDLYQHIPKTSLPREYGGTQDSIITLHQIQKQKVEAHREWFQREPRLRVDESRRRHRDAGGGQQDFGQGSFSRLELD